MKNSKTNYQPDTYLIATRNDAVTSGRILNKNPSLLLPTARQNNEWHILCAGCVPEPLGIATPIHERTAREERPLHSQPVVIAQVGDKYSVPLQHDTVDVADHNNVSDHVLADLVVESSA